MLAPRRRPSPSNASVRAGSRAAATTVIAPTPATGDAGSMPASVSPTSGGGDSIRPVGGWGRRRPGRPAWEKTELTTLHGPGSSRRKSGGGSGRVLMRSPRVV